MLETADEGLKYKEILSNVSLGKKLEQDGRRAIETSGNNILTT